jgi:predicted O-methyltransferase YrrM
MSLPQVRHIYIGKQFHSKLVVFLKNTSYDALIKLSQDKNEFFDFAFIDGCHFAKYVLEDAVLSFKLLKMGGILIFDDYGWGIHTQDDKIKPKCGIDCFLKAYEGHYNIIQSGWQIYLKKIKCEYPETEIINTETYL